MFVPPILRWSWFQLVESNGRQVRNAHLVLPRLPGESAVSVQVFTHCREKES